MWCYAGLTDASDTQQSDNITACCLAGKAICKDILPRQLFNLLVPCCRYSAYGKDVLEPLGSGEIGSPQRKTPRGSITTQGSPWGQGEKDHNIEIRPPAPLRQAHLPIPLPAVGRLDTGVEFPAQKGGYDALCQRNR